MVGTETDGSGKHTVPWEGATADSSAGTAPVLGSMSEAELEAAISVLRTDRNLTIAPAAAPAARWGATTEQLLRSGSRPLTAEQLAAARQEAARHAWFIGLGERVVGPIDLEALRAYWDQGELGPDSPCWREGFEDWQAVCRVPALSEVLAPSPRAPVSARHMIPVERTEGPAFQLKGTEALRALTRATPPPLTAKHVVAAPLAPALDPEPVTAPAAPGLAPQLDQEPATIPEAPAVGTAAPAVRPAVELAGTHPVVAPTQVEVRIRGGLWLALGGGLVGGVLVALVLWALGPRGGGLGSGFHPGSLVSTAAPVQTSAAAPSAAEAPKPSAASAAAAPPALPGPGSTLPGPVVDKGAAFAGSMGSFVVPFGTPALGTVASGVTGPAMTSAMPPAPVARPTATPARTEPASQPVTVAPRPVVTAPPLRKAEKVEVAFEQEAPVQEARKAPAAAEDELDEALGPDEAFARELDGPRGGAKPALAQRTVWVPPEPARPEASATLSQSDIFAVVLANKGDIAACAGAGRSQGPEDGKRVVVRWSIAPSGKVKDVLTETEAFQGTALAQCLEAKIRAWTFPRHREQGGAVRFPFVF